MPFVDAVNVEFRAAVEEPIATAFVAALGVFDGVILAIEQQNQAGGIHGRPIELIVRDDGQDKDQAVKAAQELIALKPEIVIGPVTSTMAAVVIPSFLIAKPWVR